MNFKKIRIGNTFWILLVLYFFGYTHVLGGPFWLARFFFITILVGTLLFSVSVYAFSSFIKRKTIKKPSDEKIKVDAKIIE